MKKLSDYVDEIKKSKEANMKPQRIMAPLSETKEALWNSSKDRWSRNAKHPITVTETIDDPIWEIGDKALYNGQEVEIKIPVGPNNTVGIIVEGNLKMVNQSKLEEGIMGIVKPIDTIGRMMQLAGLSSPSIEETESKKLKCKSCGDEFSPSYGEYSRCSKCLDKQHADAEHATKVQETELNENVSPNVFDQLVTAQLNGEFKGNENAARMAALGQILVGTRDIVGDLKTESSGAVKPDVMTKLEALDAFGALLINEARVLNKPKAQE